MELYEVDSKAERELRDKAIRERIPFGGSMELIPMCNMHCKMCYVYQNRDEMERQGRILTCDEWLEIIGQARSEGLLFLLLTGGEPLLYPEFKRLYTSLIQMGIIVSVNTNATLINKEWASFFGDNPCRRLNISLYGQDNETYGKLCGNPEGFSQVMKAARLLKDRNVRFRFTCSITDDNFDELEELFAIAKEFDVPFQPTSYMFPAVRRGISAEKQVRLEPEKAARLMFQSYLFQKGHDGMESSIYRTLACLFLPPRIACVNGKYYSCNAGKSGFWLNWKGEMMPCGMMEGPGFSLLANSFKECWEQINKATSGTTYCRDCVTCRLQNVCRVCPAGLLAETGSMEQRPDYVCRFTKELVRLQINYLPQEKREPYTIILNKPYEWCHRACGCEP